MKGFRILSLVLTLAVAVTAVPAGVYADTDSSGSGGSETSAVVMENDNSDGVENGSGDGGDDVSENENSNSNAPVTVKLNTTDHIRYMNGSSDGLFHPGNSLTRAEAAQMIYSLLFNASDGDIIQHITFRDVDDNAWYGKAVNSLAGYGVMSGSEGRFRPGAKITRAEFIKILSNFYGQEERSENGLSFSDVSQDFWGYDVVLWAARKGWVTGYSDGTFRPNNTLTRAEAAVVINRVLGRTGDSETIKSAEGIRIFPDVDKTHWAYGNIMEATIGHEYTVDGAGEIWTDFTREKTVLSPGTHVIDGILYRVDGEGQFVTNSYADGHWYDANGRYVTGNAQLDSLMRAATRASVKPGMTQHQMLQATFDYMIQNYTYISRAKLSTGDTGWTEEYAVPMFQKHKGNCYSFAAAYYYLAKNIGYNPREVAGLVGHNRRPHGWIEIDLGATTYIYDTELTMAKRRDGQNYYLFEMTYSNAPFIYAKK